MGHAHCFHLRKAGAALVWGVAAFLAIQFACIVLMEKRYPRVYDPEFGTRLALLRARQGEGPGRPLLLVLGSSRTVLGFRPEILPALRTRAGEQPLVFNFSHVGAGPLFNLMSVHRLLRQGIHPRWLVVEVMPAYLAHDGDNFFQWFMEWPDLPLLRQYQSPLSLYRQIAGKWLTRGRQYQAEFLRCQAPFLDPPPDPSLDQHLDRLGGRASLGQSLSPTECRRRLAIAQNQYFDILQHLRITPVADRALRELAHLCRREGIQLTLVLAPEGSAFRSWYPREAQDRLSCYLGKLSRAEEVPVVDGRRWLADSAFYDSHHVLDPGAVVFTRCLEKEVLQPIVEGELEKASSLPSPSSGREACVPPCISHR